MRHYQLQNLDFNLDYVTLIQDIVTVPGEEFWNETNKTYHYFQAHVLGVSQHLIFKYDTLEMAEHARNLLIQHWRGLV